MVIEASDLVQFADTLSKKKAAIECHLGLEVQCDVRDNPVQQLSRILKLIGLRFERVRARKEKGRKLYTYRLAPEPLARMKGIVDARKALLREEGPRTETI